MTSSVPSENVALQHGNCDLPGLRIRGYSLETRNSQGFVGDAASQPAFRKMLDSFWTRLHSRGTRLISLDNDQLDHLMRDGTGMEAKVIGLAIEEFAERLADVIERFAIEPTWAGVERIAVGGGFKESAVGRLAVAKAGDRLTARGSALTLQLLHHSADVGGLAGWAQMLPVPQVKVPNRFLAVDIGGTNVRCGIVETRPSGRSLEPALVKLVKWRHADGSDRQIDLVERIVATLRALIGSAGESLLPFIGIGCPGHIRADGSIEGGTQNLPGDWESASFHLPRRLAENIPSIGGSATAVLMHNDAVVQGLSEATWMRDVSAWAVLTIGTGLGNASFHNRWSNDAPVIGAIDGAGGATS